MGPEGEINHEDAHSRSISADRARDPGSGKISILSSVFLFVNCINYVTSV